jgi:manganese-dependent inorganic pyrophosphatase
MAEIYVTGHKNPDMDSTCSSFCYTHLKNILDSGNTYTAVRCGNLNKQTKSVFKRLDLEPPELKKDVYPRVIDVAWRNLLRLDIESPVLAAVRGIDERNLSVIPVFSGEDFRGIVSVHEITRFFIQENTGIRPVHNFLIDNFGEVLPGYFLKKGDHREFEAPIMTGAMPYTVSIERLSRLSPLKPVLIVGLRKDIVMHAVERRLPALILTGVENGDMEGIDFSDYPGHVFISEIDTAETIRLLRLSIPVKHIMEIRPKRVESSDHFDEAKAVLLDSMVRGLPVFDGDRFEGVVTRRCFIEKPKRKIILMDHNELEQSIPGSEQAEIVEIIDHHRLSAEKTFEPIYFYSKPVGSTCTIVFQHFVHNGVKIGPRHATLLLAGILSDTVMLKSPTTTGEDRSALGKLEEIAGIDAMKFGEEMFSQTVILRTAQPKKLITADFKSYSEYGYDVGIGQVEVVTLEDVDEIKTKYRKALEGVRKEMGLDWVMLLITNVLKENSMLLSTDFPGAENSLVYKKHSPHFYRLPGVLSRKKQLLPEILRVLEELS